MQTAMLSTERILSYTNTGGFARLSSQEMFNFHWRDRPFDECFLNCRERHNEYV